MSREHLAQQIGTICIDRFSNEEAFHTEPLNEDTLETEGNHGGRALPKFYKVNSLEKRKREDA